MRSERIQISTNERLEVVEITDRVSAAIPPDATGTATVFVEHTTAAVTVNEAESRLLGDFETALGDFVPGDGWAHDQIDDNADAHVRAMLVGPSVTLPVAEGILKLGTWQSVLLVECDGPRGAGHRLRGSLPASAGRPVYGFQHDAFGQAPALAGFLLANLGQTLRRDALILPQRVDHFEYVRQFLDVAALGVLLNFLA